MRERSRHTQETRSRTATTPQPGERATHADHTVGLIQRACACGGTCGRCNDDSLELQPKLHVGAADTVYEREADRVADEVMRPPGPAMQPPTISPLGTGPAISRRTVEGAAKPRGRAARVESALRSPGRPLDTASRARFEPRFGRDLGDVRVHADTVAAQSAADLGARAYTLGRDVVFGAGQYDPASDSGRLLIAHELTHVVQQGADSHAPTTIQRDPVYPDATCDAVQDDINAAWGTARAWVQEAVNRLRNPEDVRGSLQGRFRIDVEDDTHRADLQTVQSRFDRMLEIFDMNVDQRCTAAGAACRLGDGRIFAAYVHGGRPQDGIWHCLEDAETSFLNRSTLVHALVHEVAHLVHDDVDDFANRGDSSGLAALTRQQARDNAESYALFAREQFLGTTSTSPMQFGFGTGVMFSSTRPRWVITASEDLRGRHGLEAFDLIGGIHAFISLDPAAAGDEPIVRDIGGSIDVGFIHRTPRTRFFADVRAGAFGSVDVGDPRHGNRLGMSVSTLLGWADSGFQGAIQTQMLFDFLQGNHAVIIGGEFRFLP